MGSDPDQRRSTAGRGRLNVLLAAAVLVAIASGIAVLLHGGSTDPSATSFLDGLDKPSWQPPDSWFGPVWTALYISIAVSLALCLTAPGADRGLVGRVFAINIALNAAWTPLFFGVELPWLAGVEILLLLASCVWLVRTAWAARPVAGALLVPYTAWVSFATVLNWSIVALNL